MKRNIININSYKYLIEYYDADDDLKNNQYSAQFVMFRNFNIMNNIVCDSDIYIVERDHLNEYINELKNNKTSFGNAICFPVTGLKTNSYSNSYLKFNDNYNVNILGENSSIYNGDDLGLDVYELYEITNDHKLLNKKIKCDKFRIYHPLTKKNLNAIIDINNYINGIHFHYLCKPITSYDTNSITEIKYNNESYSEYVEVYFPNLHDLFKINDDGTYDTFYKEDYNIVASTRNEKFINSILSNDKELDHSEFIGDSQIVPLNLLIQPYRIIEEYAANSEFNYDDNLANDEKIFVKLFLKTNIDINNNYLSFPISLRIYPYSYIDDITKLYMIDEELPSSAISINKEFKFSLMSRLGFSDGIISVVSLFNYPNKSYFYNKAKQINEDVDNEVSSGPKTSPIKEAYKYYNMVDDNDYLMFVNEEIEAEMADIDKITELTDEMKKTVKEVANANYADDEELLKLWKDLMKTTIVKEYEEEFGTPGNFLGFKIEIATDISFAHIIYNKNARVNFNELDDFSFKLNGIFDKWEQRPEKLIVRCAFYDRIIGTEINSNLVIITKEWFKYLINNVNVYHLTDLSYINKTHDNINMNVVNLTYDNEIQKLNELKDLVVEDNIIAKIDDIINDLENESINKVNFINSIKCIVNKKNDNQSLKVSTNNQKIIFKPIFYQVSNLQNISIRSAITQIIGINLSEYITKVTAFKLIIDNKEIIEYGRHDIIILFKINANDLSSEAGTYHITNEDGTYISSGNWIKI